MLQHVTLKLKEDLGQKRDSRTHSFYKQLTCMPAFVGVAPGRQKVLLGDSTSVYGLPDDHVLDAENELLDHATRIEAIVNNQSEREIFVRWLRSQSMGVTAPFTGPASTGFDELDTFASEHARRYEFQFMSSTKMELMSRTECTDTHLALVKAVGLWLWHKTLESPRLRLRGNKLLRSPTRWACVTDLVDVSYNPSIPIIWGMATEKLNSSTQMTILGLRLWADDTFSPMPRVRNNKDVRHFIECDFVESMAGRGALLLDYDRIANGLSDWTRQNIKDGLKSIVTNAIDLSMGIGEKLYSCGCGDGHTGIKALTRLADSQAGNRAPVRRSAFREFAENQEMRFDDIPRDMLEPPLIFHGYEELVPPEIFRICNYLGHWWTERCSHSPGADHVRDDDSGRRFHLVDTLFERLETDWVNNRVHEDIVESTRGKQVRGIIGQVASVLRQDGLLNVTQVDEMKREWPWVNSWDVE